MLRTRAPSAPQNVRYVRSVLSVPPPPALGSRPLLASLGYASGPPSQPPSAPSSRGCVYSCIGIRPPPRRSFGLLDFPSLHFGFPLLSPSSLVSLGVRSRTTYLFACCLCFVVHVCSLCACLVSSCTTSHPRIRPLLAHHPPLHRRPHHHIIISTASTTHCPLAYPTLPYRPA